MEAYTLTTQYNKNIFDWFKNLPIIEDESIEIIVISKKEKKRNNFFSLNDINSLGTIQLTIDPLKFQKKIRNEW